MKNSTTYCHVNIVKGGGEYFNRMIALINEAKTLIHLQTYILEEDQTGLSIMDALKRASTRGVLIYLMADGYASQKLSHSLIDQLKLSGIHFRFFEPLFKSKYFYIGRRMHHKIMVMDARIALMGGLNISNHYNDLPGKPAWLDFYVELDGDAAKQLCTLCSKMWSRRKKEQMHALCKDVVFMQKNTINHLSKVSLKRNDWVMGKNEISNSYILMLRNAQKEIIIMSSYFLPGKIIRKELMDAVKRGVKVKLILAGKSDLLIVKRAERWLYDWLLRNNMEIYEYQKTILHAKVGMADDDFILMGSYNINNISAYASVELNLEVKDKLVNKQMKDYVERDILPNCDFITKEYKRFITDPLIQLARWMSYQIIRIVFHVFTFYFKQHIH